MTAPRALAAFDMDGTLLDGRFVHALAKVGHVEEQVRNIQASPRPGYQQTEAVAALFAGLSESDFVGAAESIPFARNCERTISELKNAGYATGVISDSYTIVAERVARSLGMDFVSANQHEFVDGKSTGRVSMPMGWEKVGCSCRLSVCKRYHLEKHSQELGVPIALTVAVGDTKSDMCMIRRAGLGIAFMPKDEVIRTCEHIVDTADFADILPLVERERQAGGQQLRA